MVLLVASDDSVEHKIRQKWGCDQGFRKKVDARFFAKKGSQHFFMSRLDIMAKC